MLLLKKRFIYLFFFFLIFSLQNSSAQIEIIPVPDFDTTGRETPVDSAVTLEDTTQNSNKEVNSSVQKSNDEISGIAGVLIDSTNQEPLIGASVMVEGKNLGASSDLDGAFFIPNVADGSYRLQISYLGYKPTTVKVVVKNGKSENLKVNVPQETDALKEVQVIGIRKTNSDRAVIQEVKNSEQVVSAISAEQISKSQDRDAAQIIKRVPGVTIVDNRFVMVRGLSQRYNNVLINGVIAPSTEPDSRSFSFDIVPSSMLDRVMIYKSGSAELPGDFAGAVIKLYTKNTVDENYVAVGLISGVRAGTTFNRFKTYQGGKTDFLGFDNSSRSLPDGFPRNFATIDAANRSVLETQSKKLSNTWAMQNTTASPDLRFNIELAKKFFIKSLMVSNITNVSYSNVFQSAKASRTRYDSYATDFTSLTKDKYVDNQYYNSVRSGILHNWSVVINQNHKIDFRNLFTQLGNKETIFREGEDVANQNEIRSYSYRYMSRGIYSGQLQGSHTFNKQRSNFTWIMGLANTKRDEPDWKRARTYRPSGTQGIFKVDVPIGASISSAARFFSELNERALMTSGDYEHRLVRDADSTGVSLKVGYYIENKNRDFEARWLSYRKTNGNGTDFNEALETLPIETIFSNENINATNGFVLNEGTNPTDRYYANNFLSAGYVGLSIPFLSRFNMSTGVRGEYNYQTLRLKPYGRDTVDNPIFSVLPFANLTYNITKKMVLRGAYSKTVNRPEFREIAPFSFYDFEFFADRVGNPLLKMATIHNADLRWELYPSPSEMISFGLFYKRFITPIESYVIPGGSNPVFIFDNADLATSQGAEVEIRKSFYELSERKLVKNTSLLLNASIINSKVDLGDRENLAKSRPLQGQSPYVINTGIYYSDDSLRFQVSILYNVFGKRIMSVGDNEIRTIYEMPRNALDLTITKKIGEGFTFQLGITDLLNQRILLKEDGNYDNKIDNDLVDKPILEFRRGQYVTLGAAYKF